MSANALRIVAWIGVVGASVSLAMTVLSTIIESQNGVFWSLVATSVFAAIPYLAMQVHLRRSGELDGQERAAWNAQTWGLSGFLVAPFYLLRKDKRLVRRRR